MRIEWANLPPLESPLPLEEQRFRFTLRLVERTVTPVPGRRKWRTLYRVEVLEAHSE